MGYFKQNPRWNPVYKTGTSRAARGKPSLMSLWWALGCLLEPSLETTEWVQPPCFGGTW